MRFSWTYKHRLAVLSGIMMVLQGAGLSQAQFAPINNPSQIYGQQNQPNGLQQTYAKPKVFGQLGANNLTQQQGLAQTQPQSYTPAPQQSYVQTPIQVPQQTQVPQQGYGQPQTQLQQTQQPRVAFNPTVTRNVGQSPVYGQQVAGQQQAFSQPQTIPQYTARAFQDNAAGTVPTLTESVVPHNAPMEANQVPAANTMAAPAPSYLSTPAASYGGSDSCSTGYNTFANGRLLGVRRNCGRRWFGGVYGLLMERDTSNYNIPLAFATSTGNAAPYYPTASEVVMSTSDADTGFQGGMEIRIGATLGGRFGGGGCGTSGCDTGYNTFSGGCCGCPSACGCGPTLAWEMVYWGLPEEVTTSTITDMPSDGTRTYGMMPYNGWEYDAGSGYRPMNDYFDYGSPTSTNDVEIRSLTMRRRFSAQNVELNLLRLPILNGGCGNGCGPRYELTTLVGARFMRFDDDFSLESSWENTTSSATGMITYNSEIDNKLYGLQLGCNGACRFGSCGRWGLHCSTSVGVYGNSISARQWVPGMARYIGGSNEPFDISSSKDEISMLGELRLGASYQYSCNWRFYGGWRILGLSGVATATDQFASAPVSAGWIDSSGSLILHGLQTGVECTY